MADSVSHTPANHFYIMPRVPYYNAAPICVRKPDFKMVTVADAVHITEKLDAAEILASIRQPNIYLPYMTPEWAYYIMDRAGWKPVPNPDDDRYLESLTATYANALREWFRLVAGEHKTQTQLPALTQVPDHSNNSNPIQELSDDANNYPIHEAPVIPHPSRDVSNSEHIMDTVGDADEESQTTVDAQTSSPIKQATKQSSSPAEKSPHLRSRGTPLNRGHMEMFTKAIGRVVSSYKDTDIMPDFSVPFEAREEEAEIVKRFFEKEHKEPPQDGSPSGRKKLSPFTKKHTSHAAALKKWQTTKKGVFMSAAMVYELNCHIDVAGKAEDKSLHPFNWSDLDPHHATPGSPHGKPFLSSSSASPGPASPPEARPQIDNNVNFSLHELNATRCQAGAGINVALVRPIMRTMRPKNDQTFQLKTKNSKGHPDEDELAGILADKNWLPRMVETKNEGKNIAKETIVNRDWYDALGTKQERIFWLKKVLAEKAKLEYASGARKNGDDDEDRKRRDSGYKAGEVKGAKRKLSETVEPASQGARKSRRAVRKSRKAVDAVDDAVDGEE